MPRPKKVKKESPSAIGNKHELEYKQMLIEEGWLTHKTQMARGWEKNKDIFNLFDIIALKGQRIRLVQTKTTNLEGSVVKIKEWANKNKDNIADNIEMEVALKKYASKRKVARWRVFIISKNPEVKVEHYDRDAGKRMGEHKCDLPVGFIHEDNEKWVCNLCKAKYFFLLDEEEGSGWWVKEKEGG